jgi:hypothetical protein
MTQNIKKNKTERIKVGFFQDHKGDLSSMRLMSFIALVAAIIFGVLTILIKDANSGNGIYITFGFLLAAFAPKALQKFAEIKIK